MSRPRTWPRDPRRRRGPRQEALWFGWLTANLSKDIEFTRLHGQTLAQCIVSMIFVGGFVGKLTPSLNVANDIVELTFGNLNTFKVNYEIGSHYNAFFIVDNIPIPIMAKYYDIDGNVQYSYNLLSFDMTYEPLYNLYTFTSNHSANSIISLLHLHHK